MTVAVGVTGHRVLAERDKIAAGIDQALDHLERVFPNRPLLGLSALAEGADRLAAVRILTRPGARLHAPLPLPREEYLADFATDDSKQAFLDLLRRTEEVIELPAHGTRDEAYEAVGEYVLRHSDVLLAVWDGQGAQGQGGTGAIVARARERGLPIAWVHAGNRRGGPLEPTSLGEEQGRLTLENF